MVGCACRRSLQGSGWYVVRRGKGGALTLLGVHQVWDRLCELKDTKGGVSGRDQPTACGRGTAENYGGADTHLIQTPTLASDTGMPRSADLAHGCYYDASPGVPSAQPTVAQHWLRVDEVLSGLFGEEHAVQTPRCAKAQTSLLGTPGTDTDMLVNVTFHAIHDSAPANATMYLTGSLPSLGSWDLKRARKMNCNINGSWDLAIYMEKEEFLYQYLLLQEPEADAASQEPIVLWEGRLQGTCKLVESLPFNERQPFVDGRAVMAGGGGDTDVTPPSEKGDLAEIHQKAMSILAGIGDALHYKKAHERLESTCKRAMNLFSGSTVACPSPLKPSRAFQREHAAAPRRLAAPHYHSRSLIKKTRPPASISHGTSRCSATARDSKMLLESPPRRPPPPPPDQHNKTKEAIFST